MKKRRILNVLSTRSRKALDLIRRVQAVLALDKGRAGVDALRDFSVGLLVTSLIADKVLARESEERRASQEASVVPDATEQDGQDLDQLADAKTELGPEETIAFNGADLSEEVASEGDRVAELEESAQPQKTLGEALADLADAINLIESQQIARLESVSTYLTAEDSDIEGTLFADGEDADVVVNTSFGMIDPTVLAVLGGAAAIGVVAAVAEGVVRRQRIQARATTTALTTVAVMAVACPMVTFRAPVFMSISMTMASLISARISLLQRPYQTGRSYLVRL